MVTTAAGPAAGAVVGLTSCAADGVARTPSVTVANPTQITVRRQTVVRILPILVELNLPVLDLSTNVSKTLPLNGVVVTSLTA